MTIPATRPRKYAGTGDTLGAQNQAARLRALCLAIEWDLAHLEGFTQQMRSAAAKRVERYRAEADAWDKKAADWAASETGWHA